MSYFASSSIYHTVFNVLLLIDFWSQVFLQYTCAHEMVKKQTGCKNIQLHVTVTCAHIFSPYVLRIQIIFFYFVTNFKGIHKISIIDFAIWWLHIHWIYDSKFQYKILKKRNLSKTSNEATDQFDYNNIWNLLFLFDIFSSFSYVW